MAEEQFELRRLDENDHRPEFLCGDDDIDDFYCNDSIAHGKELLCVTYALMHGERAVAFFSVSNDAITKEKLSRSDTKKLFGLVPHRKQYRSMPSAKIGRLGVAKDLQRGGYGTRVLDYIKASFTTRNKTGCRFLVVDAYNKKKITDFYEKNGFSYLWSNDASEETRIMYFDLITFKR